MVHRRAHIFRSTLEPGEEDGDGKHVISFIVTPTQSAQITSGCVALQVTWIMHSC